MLNIEGQWAIADFCEARSHSASFFLFSNEFFRRFSKMLFGLLRRAGKLRDVSGGLREVEHDIGRGSGASRLENSDAIGRATLSQNLRRRVVDAELS